MIEVLFLSELSLKQLRLSPYAQLGLDTNASEIFNIRTEKHLFVENSLHVAPTKVNDRQPAYLFYSSCDKYIAFSPRYRLQFDNCVTVISFLWKKVFTVDIMLMLASSGSFHFNLELRNSASLLPCKPAQKVHKHQTPCLFISPPLYPPYTTRSLKTHVHLGLFLSKDLI